MGEPITKKRLMNYIHLRRENRNRLERLERLKNEELIPASRMGDGSQHTGGNSDRMANAVIRRMEYEEEIRPILEANRAEMRRIDAAINSLENPLEREVLRLRYTDSDYSRLMPWRDVAIAIYGDDDEGQMQAVYRLHGRALQNIRGINK